MLISGLFDSGALPALGASIQFAARRQGLIAHNIANLSTPNFQQKDVSPQGFQAALAEAVDQRRREFGGPRGDLKIKSTREIAVSAGGNISVTPRTPSGNILFHDRNNRDLETLMQDLAENTAAFRVSVDLMRGRMELINSAIRERL